MGKIYTDFKTWLQEETQDKLYEYLKYKKVWTPYELDEKFSDESEYEDSVWKTVKILGAIELPDKDILLKLQRWDWLLEYDDDGYSTEKFEQLGAPFFEKLSDIILQEHQEKEN